VVLGEREPDPRIDAPAERPLTAALIDRRWRPGELRAWLPNQDGTWRADVGYSAGRFRTGWQRCLRSAWVRSWTARYFDLKKSGRGGA
jgi:hypothetical protein